MISLSKVRQDFYELKNSIQRQDAQHIRIDGELTHIYGSD